MTTRDINAGVRRILYDAMILSSSLRYMRESKSYKTKSAKNIDGQTEAHAIHALLQIRSMIDFLVGNCQIHRDTMLSVQFFGCSKQKIDFPERKAANKYAAHKSWDAVTKDVAQVSKSDVMRIGLKVLEGFKKFRGECEKRNDITYNRHAKRYSQILEENVTKLKKLGVR